MEREAASIPEPEAGSEEGALADLDARKGVISNHGGGHEAGPDPPFPTTEEFVDYLASFDEEVWDSGGSQPTQRNSHSSFQHEQIVAAVVSLNVEAGAFGTLGQGAVPDVQTHSRRVKVRRWVRKADPPAGLE